MQRAVDLDGLRIMPASSEAEHRRPRDVLGLVETPSGTCLVAREPPASTCCLHEGGEHCVCVATGNGDDRTPCGATSSASALVSVMTTPLEAA